MARRDIRAERGRATRQFWASPVVTVDDADDWVAGCSPQFCGAQLTSLEPTVLLPSFDFAFGLVRGTASGGWAGGLLL